MEWLFLLPGVSFGMERQVARDGSVTWNASVGNRQHYGFPSSSAAYQWIRAHLIQ